ncbi:MAG: ATP-binding cassette domain-containing protein, partial [Gaiellales bacterium]
MTSSVPLVSAAGVSRFFGRRVALEPTDLELYGAETLALVGPNGAGKSTLLAVLAGALRPSGGRVLRATPPPKVSWVPQRPALYGRLTARENLELFARLEGTAQPRAAARRLLEVVEIPDDGAVAATLSAGNQQRVNLAIALLDPPDVLLLDEPTAALDPRQRRRFWTIVDSVRGAGGGVVFVTQNLEEVGAHADRVAVLEAGRLVFAGTTAE